MARSIYVMPLVTVQGKYGPEPQEKYFSIVSKYGTHGKFTYGREPWCLCAIDGISAEDDAALDAHSDVFKLPDNLDQTMGNTTARNRVRNALEAVNMPGTWVQTSTTYRTVVRFIGALCMYMGCFSDHYDIPAAFGGAVTLATTFGELSQRQQEAAQGCIDYFGLNVTPSSGDTLRVLLKEIANDFIAQMVAGTNEFTKLELVGAL